MSETNNNESLNKLLSLNKEELEKIFFQLSLKEIENLFDKLSGVLKND